MLLFTVEKFAGTGTAYLRLAPARNGQRAAVNFAADYRLGAVAQLEERSAGSRKARGSSPLSSIPSCNLVGVDRCRQRFSQYVELAAAGETVLITRRGKPYARLCPPSEQLDLSSRQGHIGA